MLGRSTSIINKNIMSNTLNYHKNQMMYTLYINTHCHEIENLKSIFCYNLIIIINRVKELIVNQASQP